MKSSSGSHVMFDFSRSCRQDMAERYSQQSIHAVHACGNKFLLVKAGLIRVSRGVVIGAQPEDKVPHVICSQLNCHRDHCPCFECPSDGPCRKFASRGLVGPVRGAPGVSANATAAASVVMLVL